MHVRACVNEGQVRIGEHVEARRGLSSVSARTATTPAPVCCRLPPLLAKCADGLMADPAQPSVGDEPHPLAQFSAQRLRVRW
jgi:hypothetical protein